MEIYILLVFVTLLIFDITPLRERAIAIPCKEAQLFVEWVTHNDSLQNQSVFNRLRL
ncbi:hypothetical protein [Cylindrospermopsis raciborskii]|uniref:hypothetical protein n=1 Tax=Cylindrospermopsis raciborskii TaxID=77022 RepID=UPI001BAD3EAC|nr:hypothetical protein [Cylindrospermopsis raciborskii]